MICLNFVLQWASYEIMLDTQKKKKIEELKENEYKPKAVQK